MDLKVEVVPIETIRPYEQNPRNNAAAVSAVAKSIAEFGFRQPIVVDAAGVIVCGHTRYKAALELGLETVPVHVAAGLTPGQTRALRITDNKTAALSTWDEALLPLELSALIEDGVDLEALGWGSIELERLVGPGPAGGLTDPDLIPEPLGEAKTERGTLYQLGSHRLLCGDSGSEADLDRLLAGAPVHLTLTDPPYNVLVNPRSRRALLSGASDGLPDPEVRSGKAKLKKGQKMRPKDRPLDGDFLEPSAFEGLLDAWFKNFARVLLPGRAFYVWGGYSNLENYIPALRAAGLHFAQVIVWDKLHPHLTRLDFLQAFELAFYGWKEGGPHKFFGPRTATNLWHLQKIPPQSMVHLTEKPVELAELPIEYSSERGENVLDLFGGSGSTLIAAERTGRRAFLMEIDGHYCDLIVKRFEDFTGEKAKRLAP